MSATNQIDLILFTEVFHNLIAEDEADPTVVVLPRFRVFVGVRPEQITQQASVRNVRRSHNIIHREYTI